MFSKKLVGRKLSATEVSEANTQLVEAIERWRNPDLSAQRIKYISLDGVCFDMRDKAED